jgi:hypothetical protein
LLLEGTNRYIIVLLYIIQIQQSGSTFGPTQGLRA